MSSVAPTEPIDNVSVVSKLGSTRRRKELVDRLEIVAFITMALPPTSHLPRFPSSDVWLLTLPPVGVGVGAGLTTVGIFCGRGATVKTHVSRSPFGADTICCVEAYEDATVDKFPETLHTPDSTPVPSSLHPDSSKRFNTSDDADCKLEHFVHRGPPAAVLDTIGDSGGGASGGGCGCGGCGLPLKEWYLCTYLCTFTPPMPPTFEAKLLTDVITGLVFNALPDAIL